MHVPVKLGTAVADRYAIVSAVVLLCPECEAVEVAMGMSWPVGDSLA